MDEVSILKEQRKRRKMQKEKELRMMSKVIRIMSYIYAVTCAGYIVWYLRTEKWFDYKGKVEDSCQDLEVLQRTNEQVYPLIDELTYKKFFRIFRVNLVNDCPFWVGDFICNNRKCAVCECNQADIPQHWLAPQSDFITQPQVDQAYWESERDRGIDQWQWHVEDLQNDDGIYADLKINPEAYTGYQGQHIWEVIYKENCFKGNEWDSLCREERALNKMISGLHASISTQLSEHYIDLAKNKTYPNYPLFFQKVGNYPDRVRNLFFLYSVLLRALNVAQSVIDDYDINSQSFIEDVQAKKLLKDIFNITMSQCSHPFDEKSFFSEIKQETKRQYQRYIQNISMIMDCVECEKCKLYGKMQTYGLGIVFQNLRQGTALKILFSDNPHEFLGRIKRNELIAFVNTFAKVSSSVHSVSLMYQRRYRGLHNWGMIIFVLQGSLILFFMICRKIYGEMGQKVSKMFKNMPRLREEAGKAKRD